MKFQFRLQAVLTLRQHQRDTEQRNLAAARCRLADQIAQRDNLVQLRELQRQEIRSMNDDPALFSTDQIIAGQRYVEQLGQALSSAEAEVQRSALEVDVGLRRLLEVDQSVRSLEKLAERQLAEFAAQQTALFARDLDDRQKLAS